MTAAIQASIEAAEKAGHTDATITAGDLAAACEPQADDPHAAGLLKVARESVNAGRPGTPIGLPVGHLRRLLPNPAGDFAGHTAADCAPLDGEDQTV
jgi:hypothetical protein